jgi:branched-chain amino acid transport system permease protein
VRAPTVPQTLRQSLKQSARRRWFYYLPLAVVFVVLLAIPAANNTPLVSLLTRILIFGLLAMSLDIAFGYTGMWSFGHAAIFGAAAYTDALFIERGIITSFWLLVPICMIVAAIVAAIFAALAIRTSGLYFMLITFALGQLINSIAIQWKSATHGDDGLWGISYPNVGFGLSRTTFYYFTLFILIVCALIFRRFIKSPFGYSLVAIRENETRARAMGYNTRLRKVLAFVISGAFAGLAGILFVHYNGGISPQNVGMSASGLAMTMVIVGGSATLYGPVIGAGIILLLQYFISLYTPERWPIFLGAIFIICVFLAKGGAGGILPRLSKVWNQVTGNERTDA